MGIAGSVSSWLRSIREKYQKRENDQERWTTMLNNRAMERRDAGLLRSQIKGSSPNDDSQRCRIYYWCAP